MSCEGEIVASILFGVFGLAWGVFGLWWIVNTYCKNRLFTKPLQRITLPS